MQTIVELPEYIRKVRSLLTVSEKDSIINYLATHPKSGVLIQGTGGVRKLRWALGNKGKSGGVRIVYFYHNTTIPVFLLTLFGKNNKENLTKEERNELAKLVKLIVTNYGVNNV